MNQHNFENIYEENNSFLIVGDRKKITQDIKNAFLKKEVIFFLQEKESYGIDDSTTLKKELQSTTPTKRVCILSFSRVTIEAQNSLLKSLEEEHKNTSVVIIVDNKEKLLKTVLSRLIVLTSKEEKNTNSTEIQLFLSLSPTKRMQHGVLKNVFDTKKTKIDISKEEVQTFLEQVIVYLSSYRALEYNNEIKDCVRALSVLAVPGASTKQITEYILLRLPVLK